MRENRLTFSFFLIFSSLISILLSAHFFICLLIHSSYRSAITCPAKNLGSGLEGDVDLYYATTQGRSKSSILRFLVSASPQLGPPDLLLASQTL